MNVGSGRGARWAVLLAVLAAAGTGFGCASLSGRSRGAPEPVTVSVRNQNLNTVHAYVTYGGALHSLGQLATQDTATYAVPQSLVAGEYSIQLLARPIGASGQYLSRTLYVQPGDRIRWTIGSPLWQSHVEIY